MPVPVISVAQMRQWEAATWAAGQSEAEVIRRAGCAVADCARRLTSASDRILIVAGKGNNGADARLAGEALTDRPQRLLNVRDPAADAKALNELLREQPALVIDGLFGIGLNRPLDADWCRLIGAINGCGARLLAVDSPSGLDADTGAVCGAAIRAEVTLTLGAPKGGLLSQRAWPHVGRLEVAPDIGLLPCPCASEMMWTLPADFRDYPPRRPAHAHKGDFGHLVIIGGSFGYHGAGVLAARGALRAMPGLVTLYTTADAFGPVAGQLQAAMVRVWQADSVVPDFCDALLVGPGLAGHDVPGQLRELVRRLWQKAPFPMIVDASALDWLTPVARPVEALRVVTPHPGEAARLLGAHTAEIQHDRPAAVRELSSRLGGCWVVLKGHQTLLGRSTGELHVNSSGNPCLAQGGSGDLLAGFLAGLLVQAALQADPQTALRYGVWAHGAAADRLSAARKHWAVEQLADELGNQ
jgi:NAD(P)H-hydrate epimerase